MRTENIDWNVNECILVENDIGSKRLIVFIAHFIAARNRSDFMIYLTFNEFCTYLEKVPLQLITVHKYEKDRGIVCEE